MGEVDEPAPEAPVVPVAPVVLLTIRLQLPGDPPRAIQFRSNVMAPADDLTIADFAAIVGKRAQNVTLGLFDYLRENPATNEIEGENTA